MQKNVYLFVPNLIGYGRIICMILALLCWQRSRAFLLLYSASFGFDAWDGYFARLLDQIILGVLSVVYRDQAYIFTALMLLDCFSHWGQTCSGLCSGAKSHKEAGNESPLIRLYYRRTVLTLVCMFNELFLIMLYTLRYHPGPEWLVTVFTWGICFPTFLLKQLVNVAQIIAAHQTLLSAPPSL